MDKNQYARQALQETAKRELARRNVRDFVDYMFNDYVFGLWHKQFFSKLERVKSGELKRLMVFLPPRSGKSEVISKLFPAYVLGTSPHKKIVCASYGSELAVDFGRKTRSIVRDPLYKTIFPDFSLSDDKREAGSWETKQGGGYYAVGVQGALTGKGYDIGIIDDPTKDRQDAESMTVQQRGKDWYDSVFYTRRQSKDSAIIILMTRWHESDLAGMLLEEEKNGGDKWETLCYPALDDYDKSFFPERFDDNFYVTTRAQIGERDFAALYQQDPIKSMGAVFKKEQFRYFALSDFEKKDSPVKKEHFEVWIICDPAFSTRETADDLVVMAMGLNLHTNETYILDVVAGHYPPSVGQTLPVNMAQKWKKLGYKVTTIDVEDVSLNRQQQLFVDGVDNEMRRQGAFFSLNRHKPTGKKEDRIKFTLEPRFSRNAVYFRADDTANDAWRVLEGQLLKFPVSRKDDIMDCLSQGVSGQELAGLFSPPESEEMKIKRNKNLARIKSFMKNPFCPAMK